MKKKYIALGASIALLFAGVFLLILSLSKTPDVEEPVLLVNHEVHADNEILGIIQTVTLFQTALKSNNAASFTGLLNPAGLDILKYSVSGRQVKKGEFTRSISTVEQMLEAFTILKPDPKLNVNYNIDTNDKVKLIPSLNIFIETVKFEPKDIPIELKQAESIIIKEKTLLQKPVAEIVKICAQLCAGKEKGTIHPKIFILSNGDFILTESAVIMGQPIGSWAVFQKNNEGYLLQGIVDLR